MSITILKEKENLRVEIDNRQYGKTRIIHKGKGRKGTDLFLTFLVVDDAIFSRMDERE